ncbi:MAG: D-alanyl-lipoteichoic acid biosynthesis protein DltD [Roseburia sp.]
MKKLYFLLIALVSAFACVVGLDLLVKHSLTTNVDKAIYDNNIHTRNCSDYVMDQIIDENSIVVLGSSELNSADDLAYPPSLFNEGYSDFNMVLMGAGYLQSVSQAVNVGALQNNIKNGKVVLIVSPQWFREGELTSDAFCSRFEEANFVEFLQNDDISKTTKIEVSDRINELLASDPVTLERVEKYEDMYLDHTVNPVTYVEMSTYSVFRNAKTRFELVDEFDSLPPLDTTNYVCADEIDFDLLLSQALEVGAESCTNNEFGVDNDYYDTYIKGNLRAKKDSNVGITYASSSEYGDFRLFLDVCKETGIEPLIISVPVNGRWYDYTGFQRSERNTYYQNIRNICDEYEVTLVDFSDKEYELYFLRDIMHLGWKGWVYLDKAVYSFYKGEEIEDKTIYEELLTDSLTLSQCASKSEQGVYSITSNVSENSFNSVVVSIVEGDIVLDKSKTVGTRSGVYLHNMDTGYYTVRFRANSNMKDEYVEAKVYLEKDCVYKVKYNVDSIDSKQVAVSGISFSKVQY